MVEEYHLEGVASAYRAMGPPGPPFAAEPNGEAAYRTRILVVRPIDPDRFNGTVLLHWQNVSAGFESRAPSDGETYEGYAWVGVSAQEVGLYGSGFAMRGGGAGAALPLLDHDPARYGSLRHPGDQGSFDIFSAAAMAVGPQREGGVDPMGGLAVRRVIATGASQSAMRLATYLNWVHPRSPVIDGFVLVVWEGRAPRLEEGAVTMGFRSSIRPDLDVPVVVVNSEFETIPIHLAGVVDSEMTRIWEVTGAPHAPAPVGRHPDDTWGPNPLSVQPIFDAAVRHVHHWAKGEGGAPAQPRIEVEAGSPPRIRRDEDGNAVGGVRLPEIAVPVSEYRGTAFGTGRAPLFGASRRLPDDRLRALYSSRADYLARWSAAVDSLVDSGALRPDDAPGMKARGEDVHLPFD